MSVQRLDLSKCIGCRNCVNICPMDVFRFNEDVNKSVIAFPENCQVCGQCYVNCLGHSLALSGEAHGYPLTSVRAASLLPMNRQLYVSHTPKNRMVMPAVLTMVGAMFAHDAIIWRGKAVEQRRSVQNPTMTRMTTNMRWQHLAIMVSFILLALTGFSIRYSGSWLVHTLGMGTQLLGIVHRAAGILLIAAGVYHLFYVTAAREGRRLVRDLAPRPKDAFDLWAMIRHYLGMSKEKPKFGRFTYAEKAEYWAVAIGTVSMGLTGTMMWAYLRAASLTSVWWVSFATSWHFYEAILATLAILVWHFYQVFGDPDVAPMNWAWWDGKMPVEQYRHEHELDPEFAQKGQSE